MTVLRRLVFLTLPAILVVLVGVEVWVRASWNPRRGTPGLFLADPALVQRFAPNYSGWFAGVPVRINNLGFRDTRDYTLDKAPNTFRILLLGDSVAFGHGSIYEHTYAYLLEQRLKAWRPAVDWQVWNAGVPGYNSSQELAYLQRFGPMFTPDLVIVGFFPNDIISNDIVQEPTVAARFVAELRNRLKQWFYSYEFYRRLYLQVAWRFFASGASKRVLENLAAEEELLADVGQVENLPQQQIEDLTPLSDDVLHAVQCKNRGTAIAEVREFQQEPQSARWRAAIEGFHDLQQRGLYRIMFFVSTVPEICGPDDMYYDGGGRAWNDYFVEEMGKGAPVLSTYEYIRRYRPSQMPQAQGHALGNVNRVKADALFEFLRGQILPEDLVAGSR